MNSVRLRETSEVEANILSTQWLEYTNVYFKNLTPVFHNLVLTELNNALCSQSYFGGNKITEADRKLFRLLRDMMSQLSYQEKEKYINLSRWYSNMQSEVENSLIIKFSRMLLY